MKRRGVPSERNAAVQVRSSKPLDMDVCLKALVNEDTLLRTHCCGHIVADTLLPMMFLRLRKLGNICYGHKMFLNKIRNIFCVPDTKFVSATNVARAGKRGNICVGNNVSATICLRLPGPLRNTLPLI